MILDLLKDNYRMILAFVLTFLTGVGVGAAITDAINEKNREDDEG